MSDIHSSDDEEVLAPLASAQTTGDTPSRASTPNAASRTRRLSFDDSLTGGGINRPLSNTRPRTPRRHESPLSVTPNRERIRREEQEEAADDRPPTPRILLGAGMAVGAGAGMAVRTRVLAPTPERRRGVVERSLKQGPSRRKVRRWNNDKFVGVAAELARHNPSMAEAFLKGESEAGLYVHAPNYPLSYRSEFARLVTDESQKGAEVRERFIKGEVAEINKKSSSRHKKKRKDPTFLDGKLMLARLHHRVRTVVQNACASAENKVDSYTFSVRLLNAMELYLLSVFHNSKKEPVLPVTVPRILESILVKNPDIIYRSKSSKISNVSFCFSLEKGAFYRMMLHAVCQFHGLSTNSETSEDRRIIRVIGKFKGGEFRLVDFAKVERNATSMLNEEFVLDSFRAMKVSA